MSPYVLEGYFLIELNNLYKKGVITKEEFNKNYTNSKERRKADRIRIPMTDQLCGHDCLPITLYALGRDDGHGSRPLSETDLLQKQDSWMCVNKCRYKLNIYNN